MSVATTEQKPLEVQLTVEQHKTIAEAAEREQRSVSGFMLDAALKAAKAKSRPLQSQAKVDEAIRRVQDAMRRANPERRSIVDELIAERRAAVASE